MAARRRCRPQSGSPAISASSMSLSLVASRKAWGISVHLERRVGQFVPAGVADRRACRSRSAWRQRRALHLIAAFDIGPTRTLQQDIEFGIIQIVDIALRAMSPAVNDPEHGDQLRGPAQPHHHPLDQPRAAAVALLRAAACTAARGAVDEFRWPARYRVRADQALCRRRRRGQLAIDACLQRHRGSFRARRCSRELLERARRVATGCATHLPKDELVKLQQRLAALETSIAAAG